MDGWDRVAIVALAITILGLVVFHSWRYQECRRINPDAHPCYCATGR